jgi:hypothetical protein
MKYSFPFAKEARLEGDEPTNPGEPALLDRRPKTFAFFAAGMSPTVSGAVSLIQLTICLEVVLHNCQWFGSCFDHIGSARPQLPAAAGRRAESSDSAFLIGKLVTRRAFPFNVQPLRRGSTVRNCRKLR